MTSIAGEWQRTTAYTRNAQGDVTQVAVRQTNATGALLRQVDYGDIDSYGNVRLVTVKDGSRNVVTAYEYGTAYEGAFPTKRSVTVTAADNMASVITQQYTYDAATGHVVSATDGNGFTTQYAYDALGRITQTTHPDASTILVRYDDANNTLTLVDEMGVTAVTRWSPLGWKLEEGLVEDGVFRAKGTYGYDTHGRLIWSEDALGHRTGYAYDVWDRQTSVTYPDAASATVAYDDLASRITSADPAGNRVRETFDLVGRVIQREDIRPNNSVTVTAAYTYDDAGNVRTATDANQQTTQYSYDTMGQLVSVTNANAETTQYTYTMLGHVTQITYPNETTLTKQYDELGRLIRRIDGNAHTDTYTYDTSGNLIRRIDRNGETFTFTYNNRNWLTAKTSPDETIAFTYNASGQRLSMTDATGVTSYAYKASSGLLAMLTYPDGRTLQVDYDDNGQRRQLTDPFGGNVYYRYDQRNRLTGVGTAADDYEAEYVYASNGLLTQLTQKNGVVTTYTYNGLRLDTLTHRKADNTVLQAYSYAYDDNGNITGQTAGGSSYAYTYDALNRIATSSQFAESYTYDSRGNRTSFARNTRFENDNAELVYDDRDRLTEVTTEGGNPVTYTYNGDNLLVERTENGETIRYYYDGPNIIAEATVTGGVATLKARYIRGKGLIAAEDRYGSKAYYLQNGHGDVTELRDNTGQTSLNRYSYDMWGSPVTAEEMVHNSFRYSGGLWDDTTSLQYLRARWYDPSEGRFVSEDTFEGSIANPLTLNLYTYVHNNPLSYIDPTGNYCVSADGNWAHAGTCHSDTSIYMGEDDTLKGSPVINNGVVTGYLGKSGPFREKEFNFWEEAAYGVGTGSLDAIVGNAFANHLLKNKPIQAALPALGPAASVSGVRFPSTTNKVLAGASRIAGPVTVMLTGVEVYNDFQNYTGNDRWYASALTVTGTAVSILVVTGISAAGAPVVLVIGAGALVGAGISYGVDRLKEQLFE